jgi:ubiquinone biosynthesis protein Coq4
MNLARAIETVRAFRAGAPFGDVAVLKIDAFSPPRGIASKLERVRGYAPEQNLLALRGLPEGTLGREYARFLDANGILPLVISPGVKERFRDNPYALRYTTTHDLHHVLTGFDAGLAGEAGVYAFTVAQGSAPGGRALLHFARVVWSILSPTQARRIWHNIRIGTELGRTAALLIAQPIESYFEESLSDVRRKFGLSDPQRAGVLTSGTSIVYRLVFATKKMT